MHEKATGMVYTNRFTFALSVADRLHARFNSLCPAPLNTPLLQDWLGDDQVKRHRREIHFPTGRFGEAIEQAHAVVFLASDESSFVIGTDFTGEYSQPDIEETKSQDYDADFVPFHLQWTVVSRRLMSPLKVLLRLHRRTLARNGRACLRYDTNGLCSELP
jgi:hypothetical protein